jgi:hypothetical protein
MRRLALSFWLVSSLAFAGTGSTATVTKSTAINAAPAGSNFTPTQPTPTGDATRGSYHCKWASLTGVLDGHFDVQVSNDAGATWVAKTGAVITVSGASGSNSISLNGVVTETYYRIVWTAVGVTGGTVTCNAAFKG